MPKLRTQLLLHDFNVDFLHIHLLIELGGELGSSQELLIHGGRHRSAGRDDGPEQRREWKSDGHTKRLECHNTTERDEKEIVLKRFALDEVRLGQIFERRDSRGDPCSRRLNSSAIWR
jgi:hypothetical protein